MQFKKLIARKLFQKLKKYMRQLYSSCPEVTILLIIYSIHGQTSETNYYLWNRILLDF